MIACKVCGCQFDPTHFNQKCCSEKCRKKARAATVRKYKKSAKGAATESRWRKNPRKKEIDKKYRQTTKGRATAVRLSIRHLANSEYARASKKRTDRIYMSRTQGRLRKWWEKESTNGCAHCGTTANLTVDHVIPKSRGGTDDVSNLQVLCHICNGKKGARHEDEV